jgi:thiaminase/transcriptional activator TenA
MSTELSPHVRPLWDAMAPILHAILRHPFIEGLGTGSLPLECFKFYVIQDALYLRAFARALSLAAARAPFDEAVTLFNEHAIGALQAERMLHESFFQDFGLDREAVYRIPLAPTNVAYTSYLLAVGYGQPFHELVAALLPCYWIYWEVGKALAQRGSPHPFYQRWINTYAADAFGQLVQAVLKVADRVLREQPAYAQEVMVEHVRTTSRYEWMFWEMAWRQETWPI